MMVLCLIAQDHCGLFMFIDRFSGGKKGNEKEMDADRKYDTRIHNAYV